MLRFLKTTVLGGIVFLVPIIIFIAVIGKALELTNTLATPLAERLPVDSIGDLAVVNLMALVILVLICFVAGLAARTAVAKQFVQSLETNVLDKIPAYALMKAKAGSVLSPEDTQGMRPVLARFDDSWQLAFESERIEGGQSCCLLAGSARSVVRFGLCRYRRSDNTTRLNGQIRRCPHEAAWQGID